MTFPRRPLITISAAWVLLLIAFSYLFTLSLAAICVILPFELFVYSTQHNISFALQGFLLFLSGVLVASSILWALVPRSPKFAAPGVELSWSEQPRLQALVKEITSVLGEALPDAIYLSTDTNAFVAERGGLLGFGSRRVMSVGLPLIAVLTVHEFRALVAHECSHFYSGDTWLAPRVYTAREAMLRVLTSLDSSTGLMEMLAGVSKIAGALQSLVTALLGQYWKVFLRLANAVSRVQEYRSDELSAYIAGAAAAISGLDAVHRAGLIGDGFWADVIAPVVRAGFLPPVAESFQTYSTSLQEQTRAVLDQIMNSSKLQPFDTHPPLKLRLERLKRLHGENEVSSNGEPALALLDALDRLELSLIASTFVAETGISLKRTSWKEVGETVYLPKWRALISEQGELLEGFTVADVPALVANSSGLASRMADPPGMLLTRDQRASNARELIWKALLLGLVAHGWRLHASPGSLQLQRGEEKLDAYTFLDEWFTPEANKDAWHKFCKKAGLPEKAALWDAPNSH